MSNVQPAVGRGLDNRIRELGAKLWERIQDETPGAFDKEYWVGKVLDWTMEDRAFKVDLFRLVDVLPVLQTSDQVQEHVQEYLVKPGHDLPKALSTTLKIGSSGVLSGLASKGIRFGVTEMALRFIAAETVKEALPILRKLNKDGYAFTVDLLGEATHSAAEAEAYQGRYLELIEGLERVKEWDRVANTVSPTANVSVKVSALEPHVDPVDRDESAKRILERLRPLVHEAKSRGMFVNLDMEQSAYRGITLDVFEQLVLDPEFAGYPHLGIALQAYTTAAGDDLDRLASMARKRGTPLTIRLIKGAYWDFEIIHAKQHGHEIPVFENKSETDANFERMTVKLLEHREHLFPAFGTHNLRSIVHAIAQAEAFGLGPPDLEFQMLYGMAEPMRAALREEGYPVRVYTPVGELIPGMAYLVRRLLENTSNEGFLSQAYQKNGHFDALLKNPADVEVETEPVETRTGLDAPFVNCPHSDFTVWSIREAFQNAVNDIPSEFPMAVPVVIDGKEANVDRVVSRESPNGHDIVVARVAYATKDDAERAVATAVRAFPDWRDRDVRERAEILDRTADSLTRDRYRIAALQAYETGKPWAEGDGDVAEAIDFCRYYARRALVELGPQKLGDLPGEQNVMFYEGRGPAVVIAPWNFPLAILCGMTTASLVAGNPVIMKPAEQSSAIGYELYKHLREAGVPGDALQFLPGDGEEIGPYLVEHPDVAQIAFTGSKAVGLGIVESAAKTREGQRQLKRVVCEMGGKNAIVVDNDADYDDAVAGILHSAFGYAGQKCSACSRLFVVEPAYDSLIRRLIEATKSLTLAPAFDPACQVPPVVDREAYDRLLKVQANFDDGVEVLYKGATPGEGYFVAPTLLRIDDLDHPLMQQELFGPILAVKPVQTFEEGLDAALHSDFALTGAVYSRNPAHLDLARKRFRVGNLYLNRGSTGSIVSRQPFGGFHLSGTDTKAGGPGYLHHFADPRVVTENTLRHGFSPDVME